MHPRHVVLFACALALATACAPPRPSSDTSGSTATAPPSVDTLVATARRVTRAWAEGDTTVFRRDLSVRFVDFKSGFRVDKEGLISMVTQNSCKLERWELTDPQLAMIDSGVYVLAYAGDFVGACRGPDGRDAKLLSPTRSATIFVREGPGWAAAFHSENKIEMVAGTPRRNAARRIDSSLLANGKRTVALRDTSESAKRHAAAWRAALSGDFAALRAAMTPAVSMIDRDGQWFRGADAIVEALKKRGSCPAARSVVASGLARGDLAPNVELLTLHVKADRDCGLMDNGYYHAATWVRTAAGWQLGFLIESRG